MWDKKNHGKAAEVGQEKGCVKGGHEETKMQVGLLCVRGHGGGRCYREIVYCLVIVLLVGLMGAGLVLRDTMYREEVREMREEMDVIKEEMGRVYEETVRMKEKMSKENQEMSRGKIKEKQELFRSNGDREEKTGTKLEEPHFSEVQDSDSPWALRSTGHHLHRERRSTSLAVKGGDRKRRSRSSETTYSITAAHFQGPTNQGPSLYKPPKGDDGYVDRWRPADWVSHDEYSLDYPKRSTVTVRHAGLYYIYAQLSFFNEHQRNGWGVYVNRDVLVKCLQGNYLPSGYEQTHTCYVGRVTLLRANSTIAVRHYYRERVIVMDGQGTYFGLIKLTQF